MAMTMKILMFIISIIQFLFPFVDIEVPELPEEETTEIVEEIPAPAPLPTLYRNFRDGRSVAMEFMPNGGENISNEEIVYFFRYINCSIIFVAFKRLNYSFNTFF